ncbi:MAG: PBP1A family penicillin-binding protein [Gemmatimonadaceae bacterium]
MNIQLFGVFSVMRSAGTLTTICISAFWLALGSGAGAVTLFAQTASPVSATQTALANQPASTGEPWRLVPPPQVSVVLARDGAIIGEIGKEKRLSVSIRTLPKYLPQAFVAVEDKRFYQHDGVDLVGVAGAIKGKLMGANRGGASTITQQLVGNMHPDIIDRRENSGVAGIDRKLREQTAAREMERHYNKEQILEAYLNQISFGRGWYGVELAAQHYYGKSASEVTLSEAASLAAMPKSAVLYDPIRNPARALQRRNLILDLMATQGFITVAQAGEAKRDPIKTAPDLSRTQAQWINDIVRVQSERAGVPVSQGGFRIQTTIDAALQVSMQQALNDGVRDVELRPGFRHASCAPVATATVKVVEKTAPNPASAPTNCLEGAAVALDPTNGEVRALVGGRDYVHSSFNRAIDGNRQPGSTFKAFVYAAAINEGMTANALVQDTALRVKLDNGKFYSPDNSDNLFLGQLTMRDALAKSRNPVAVQLALTVGMDSVIALAHRSGLRSAIAPYPSSALGASVVQPLDFVAAYATFDNGGLAVAPKFIIRITDRAGSVVFTPPAAPPQPALDPRVAFIMRDMLRDVVERGTATAIRKVVPSRVVVAGKTGTTNDNSDVWFVGMTPELVTGVWMGFDRPQTIAAGAVGGTLAAPIAAQIIASYYQNRPSGTWTAPPGLVSAELDRSTGKVATLATPVDKRYTEWFLEGTEPGAHGWPWSLFRNGPILY